MSVTNPPVDESVLSGAREIMGPQVHNGPDAVQETPAGPNHQTVLESKMANPIMTRRRPMRTCCDCTSDHPAIILGRIIEDAGGCWEWTGARDREGYGNLTHAGLKWQAHRLSYFAFNGTLPDGLVIDHLCRNRACVNPDHIEMVTDRENILRGECIAAINARKVTCKRGHNEWAATVGGNRVCAACAREAQSSKLRAQLITDDPTDQRHGTTNGYGNLGCRCERCRKANADAHRGYMRQRVAAAALR